MGDAALPIRWCPQYLPINGTSDNVDIWLDINFGMNLYKLLSLNAQIIWNY